MSLANAKYYRSKSSMYRTKNKIRGTNKEGIRSFLQEHHILSSISTTIIDHYKQVAILQNYVLDDLCHFITFTQII